MNNINIDVNAENTISLEVIQENEITKPNKIKLVEKHIIKPTHELYKAINDLCFKSRLLRNKANFIIRQNFFSTKNHKFLDYNFMDKLFKRHEDLEIFYRDVPRATIAQQCLRQLNTEWTSFFKSVKEYNKDLSKYTGRPKPPKYKKNTDTYIAILLPQEEVYVVENIRICTYDAVFGFVDYGETKYNSDKIEWITKERCKVCGAAWIAENYVGGRFICPKCGAQDNNIMHIK